MFAVIETGGKQYKVSAGDTLKVERLGGKAGDAMTLDKVLAVSGDAGMSVGKPYLEGASVKATLLAESRAKKILVFKMKPRKGFKTLRGHKQYYSLIKIDEIITG
jgi:large subunit ribosomal protein L21